MTAEPARAVPTDLPTDLPTGLPVDAPASEPITEVVDGAGAVSPPGVSAPGGSPLARPLILAIRGYQRWISPALPPSCRFYPSCSAYAIEALRTHGAIRGMGLAVWRLLRCHPWHPGGIDPVPPPRPGAVAPVPAPEERASC